MKFSWKESIKWSTMIAVVTLVLAAIFSIVSTFVLSGAALAVSILVVFAIILIGVVFDTIGLAAAAADEIPFHAMASERLSGAREAILICRNADRFSSFCNDVIGDISGIVSGTASAVVVLQLVLEIGAGEDSGAHFALSVIFTSIVAALTVGGKAIGKSIALNFSTPIILFVGKIFYFLNHKFHIRLFNGYAKKEKKRDRKNS
jgi:CBS domain containing-hemolysin-like protein